MKHLLLSLSLCTFLAFYPSNAQTIFINEIHYDNDGTDQGEAIELAGPAGTDLSGWSIVLYNGASSQRAPYATTNLSGIIPDQQNGFGTIVISYPTNGIQNGSPDGIALVEPSNNIIQFLSYEGTIEAASGPAAGLTSTDINVNESSNTPVGFSLQLTGTGRSYEDFTWAEPADDNFGEVNTGQTFGDGVAIVPSIIINEVDADTPGSDTGEFIELYDGGTGSTLLDGLVVVFFNGSDDASYEAFDLDGFSTNENGYFVLGNPGVANVDLVFEPGSSGALQNGADAVALYQGSAVDFPNDTPVTTENLLDAIVYDTNDADDSGLLNGLGQSTQYNEDFNNNKDAESNSRVPDEIGEFVAQAPTPGTANENDGGGSQPTEITLIHAIQGNGDTSPLAGQVVKVEGIVVGDFQEGDGDTFNTDLDGFFVQEEASDQDDDASTSEGIFVFAPDAEDVNAGDIVQVIGTVTEFNGLTELTDVSALSILRNESLPSPIEILLPATDEELESVEGMYVNFPQELVISEYFNFDRFGEVVLALPLDDLDRPYQPTSYVEPGPAAEAIQRANELRRIVLDDARTVQNPDPARHPNGAEFTLDNRFRGGDIVQNAVGVLSYSFGNYRLQPTAGAEYSPTNPRTEKPDEVGGSLNVASFNVLNYFTTFGSRGADNQEEFERQRAKIFGALAKIDADIVGLIEIENNGNEAISNLIAGLNEVVGQDTYDFIETGVVGTDEITVAMIYKPAYVTLVGNFAVLDDPSFTDPKNSGQQKNRPALAQTFQQKATGEEFTVVVNHFKSKGSPCGEGDDDPLQGNCNVTRALAADALVKWLGNDPTGSGDPDFLIIGDLNAYDEEDPIDRIKAGADDMLGTDDDYVDLAEKFTGEFAYSYVFNGQFGYLDYAMAITSLAPQVVGATEWHINADEPDILDYDTSFKRDAQDALFQPNPYRSSDHDPVIVGLDLLPSLPISVHPVCSVYPDRFRRWEVTNTSDHPIKVYLRLTQRSLPRVRRIKPGETTLVTFRAVRKNETTLTYHYHYAGKKVAGTSESNAEVCEDEPLKVEANKKLTQRNRYRVVWDVVNPNRGHILLRYEATNQQGDIVDSGKRTVGFRTFLLTNKKTEATHYTLRYSYQNDDGEEVMGEATYEVLPIAQARQEIQVNSLASEGITEEGIEFQDNIQVFPNPVQAELFIGINSAKPEIASLKVFDTMGKLIHHENCRLQPGMNKIQLNTTRWDTAAKQLLLQIEIPSQEVRQIKLLRP